jgi:regulatory protein
MDQSRQQLNYLEALAKASEICSRSEKCAFDMEIKCREWQLSRDETDKLNAFLMQEKFIDHQRYAASFVNDKFRFNKWGKIKLAYMLRQKHLDDRIIQHALSSIPDEAYQEVLFDLLSAKAKTIKDKDAYTRRSKLLAFVQSRGFEVDEALKIMAQM